MKNLKNEVFNLLTKDENDWEFDHFHAYNKQIDRSYWIANGLTFFRIGEGSDVDIGLWNTIKLWYWLKDARRKQIINKLNK